MMERRNAPLPPHLSPEFYIGHHGGNGPTQGICANPIHPQGLAPRFLNFGPTAGLRWGQVEGMAQDW